MRRFRAYSAWRLAGALLLACLGSGQVAAAPHAERVPTPGRNASSVDDSSALAVNPAGLAHMPGVDLRWMWVRTGNGSPSSARGHAVSLGGAFPFGLGTGFRMDFVRPPDGAAAPYDAPYTWLTWGLAFGKDEASLGLSVQHIYSQRPTVGGPTSVSVGWTARPVPAFAMSAVAHDANAPKTDRGAAIGRSFALGTALRPLGTRTLELGLEGRYYPSLSRAPSSDEHWVPRVALGWDVPSVGRLRGDIEVRDPGSASARTYVATATLDVSSSVANLTGGAIFGDALGGRDGLGVIAGAALTSWHEPGIPDLSYALIIRMEETPSDREHVGLLRRLWKLSEDSEVAAVVLQLKSAPASSLAHAYELDDAVQLLRSRGKKVVCHLEDAGGKALQVCAHADRIVINPAGGIRFAGLSSERIYLAALLGKLGVRAQFVRIGAHKSAPEQFTNTAPSEPAREVALANLSTIHDEFVQLLSDGRRLDPRHVRELLASGPFTAREALRGRLVDGYAYDDELRAVASEVLGRSVATREELPTRAPKSFGRRRSVAIVYVEGNMVDGRNLSVPIFGMRLAGSYTIAEALKEAREDPHVGAVVLRIESPGGSSMAADVIWREVLLTTREKPVVVSMGGLAASGGYYIAAPGDVVFATPFTVTGSIGIFYGKADVAQLLDKVGVSVTTFRTGPRADAESIFRPFTSDEVQELGMKVKQFYDVFVDRVAAGRKLTPAAVDAVGRGRVWMGREAVSHRLVDRMGGIRQALDEARARADLATDAPVIELPRPEFSLLALAAELAGSRSSGEPARAALPPQLTEMLRAAAPFVIYAPDQPMALCDIVNAP